MDGASKFVRGDAVAGLLITGINIVGGLADRRAPAGPGPLARRFATYTILTVGDGLVTQLPALIVSTASGIVVTRAAAESELSSDLFGQLTQRPARHRDRGGHRGRLRPGPRPAHPAVPRARRGARPGRAAVYRTAGRRPPDRRSVGRARRPARPEGGGAAGARPAARGGGLQPDPAGGRPSTAAISSSASGGSAGSSPTSSASSCRRCACATTRRSAPTYAIRLTAARWRRARCYPGRLLAMNPGTRRAASRPRGPGAHVRRARALDRRRARDARAPAATPWWTRPPSWPRI